MKATMAWRCRACDGFMERLLVCSGLSKTMDAILINGSGDIGSSNGPKRVGGKACWGEGTRNKVFDQHSYCFNVKDDPKTFDEEMKSHDAAFWKEAIMMDGFVMGNYT
ncbi:hypothetical protein Tco_1159216 [Tanacetum coccineum]